MTVDIAQAAFRQGSPKIVAPVVTNNPPAVASQAEEASDPDVLHALVEEHGDSVYRLALSVARDRSLAEDIAQESLVKAWLALPKFRGEGSLRGWLLRITHNTAITVLRSRRAVVMDPTDIGDLSADIDLDFGHMESVESKVQGNVVMAEFTTSLGLLDDLSRSIVVLRELEGLSYAEIAEILKVPLPTVKTRLLRARRRISVALKEWE